MSRDEDGVVNALNWSGGAYDAIMLIDQSFRSDDDERDDDCFPQNVSEDVKQAKSNG